MSALFAVTPLDDGVVSLRIATDAEPYLGATWVGGFAETLEPLGRDPAVRAVLLEGERYFSAGASRAALLDPLNHPARYVGRTAHTLLALPVPVVAAAAGHALGGGLVLALWCDAAVLAEESLYGANFMDLGFTPGMGATHAVPEAFGAPLGRELLFSGRLLTGREIREACCPLSHAVQARDRVRDHALAVARAMTGAPRHSVTLLKANLAAGRRRALRRALRAERTARERLLADPATRPEIERRYVTDTADAGEAR